MAIVNLKDVKVVGLFSRGFRVVEESTGKDGKTYSQRFTVWSDGLGVREGDVVSLSGFLSAKVGEWTDKEGATRQSVELSLNSPRLAGAAQGASQGDSWATTPPQDYVPADGGWADSGQVPF